MRVNNRIKHPANTKLYTWTTFRCPSSRDYGECHTGEVDPCNLPEDVFEAVTAGHDVVSVIVPNHFMAVYAKNEEHIYRFKALVDKDYIRRMLGGNPLEHEALIGASYYWGTYDYPV